MRIARMLALSILTMTAVPAAAQQTTGDQEGRQIFDMVCAMCHSVQPPAKAAPPMSHAAAYYVRKYPQAADAATALAAYVRAPDAAKSALPAHAIERFGLMPAQSQLSDAQLQAVARYVLTLADTAHVGGRMGHGRHR